MSSLHFDQHQFERRSAPVNGKNGISFDDAKFMQTQRHKSKPAAWVPPFAMNDSQLQKVLLLRAWLYVGRGRSRRKLPDPDSISREEINRAATTKALRGYTIRPDAPAIQHQAHAIHQAAIRRAGGFLQLLAAIAFRSWRLGMDSVEVAETLGTTPQAVRVYLWRFRDIAKRLGFEVGRAGHTAGMTRKKPSICRRRKPLLHNRLLLKKFSRARVVELYTSGLRIPDIAVQMGYQRGHGKNRVRAHLRAAGILPPKEKPGHGGPAESTVS